MDINISLANKRSKEIVLCVATERKVLSFEMKRLTFATLVPKSQQSTLNAWRYIIHWYISKCSEKIRRQGVGRWRKNGHDILSPICLNLFFVLILRILLNSWLSFVIKIESRLCNKQGNVNCFKLRSDKYLYLICKFSIDDYTVIIYRNVQCGNGYINI